MIIDRVDLHYLRLTDVRDIGDGSQDALLVRIEAGRWEGWGEAEASPLPSIASWDCPMSHSACKPVCASVLGQALEQPADIERIYHLVKANSMDLLQADHLLSGIEIALWDLLGHALDTPVWSLLGHAEAQWKRAYASVLFGDSPDQTRNQGQTAAEAGYRAVKFGWGPFGKSLKGDRDHLYAARAGIGDADLFIDAGCAFRRDLQAAVERIRILEEVEAKWLEEPFANDEFGLYSELARQCSTPLAGGEGAHTPGQAKNLMNYGNIGFVQIDSGRIGGLTPSMEVLRWARERGIQYVNHTFTSDLALAASLAPIAGVAEMDLCETPFQPSPLARAIVKEPLPRRADGAVRLTDRPGLGVQVNWDALQSYRVPVEIRVG